jgi:hypothetical protein
MTVKQEDDVQMIEKNGLRESLGYAIGGGILIVLINGAFHIDDLSKPSLQPHLASALAGCIIGWLYDLATTMNKTMNDSLLNMRELTRIMEFQEKPLKMIKEAKHHAATVGILLQDSIGKQYNNIANVNKNGYFTYLNLALEHSSQFQAVQRYPVSWFTKNDGESYLTKLCDHKM